MVSVKDHVRNGSLHHKLLHLRLLQDIEWFHVSYCTSEIVIVIPKSNCAVDIYRKL